MTTTMRRPEPAPLVARNDVTNRIAATVTTPRSPMRAAITGAGLLLIALGLLEMVAWKMHWTSALRVRASYTPIVFNTALALALTGAGFMAAVRDRTRWVRVVGVADVFLGGLTLVEAASGRDLHVDRLFVHPYLPSPAGVPGRMALNTALCFVAIGLAFMVWNPRGRRWRRTATTIGGVCVGVVALVAVCGYVADIPTAYGWRNFARMAVPAAAGLVITAITLLMLGWTNRGNQQQQLPEWIALPAGVAAFIATGLVWQSFVELGAQQRLVSTSTVTRAVLFLATMTGALLAVTTWLAQRANRRRAEAEALAVQLKDEVERRAVAEQAARSGEQLLFQFLEAMPVGVVVAEPGPTRYYANRCAQRLLDLDADEARSGAEAMGRMVVAGTTTAYPDARTPLLRALDGEASHVDDAEVEHSDVRTPVEAWGTPVYGEDGCVRYGLAVVIDLSDRRDAEQMIAEKSTLLDLARDAIFIRNRDHRIVYWNRGAELLYGWSPQEAVGRVSLDLFHTEMPGPIDELESRLAREGHWEGEVVHYDRHGRRLVVESRWVPQLHDDGTLRSVMSINTDITARKAAEAEVALRADDLQRVNQELLRSNNDLEQFAYAASHDLAEPLRAISGPVSLLARRYGADFDDDARRYMQFAVDGCDRMQTLINDMLAFSRVGRLEGAVEDVDVEQALQVVTSMLKASIDERQASVTWHDLPTVRAEPTQLRQLFQNFVLNAIKFTDADVTPQVRVAAERVGAYWRFTITDNGIGIEPRHRERIFGMFKRLHTRDSYAGTGIGLAICKKIVERHGGTIGVDDGPGGVGSTFWFTIPATQEDPS